MFVILDLETTGLDPENCDVLEIGLLACSSNFERGVQLERVVHYTPGPHVNQFVLDMHKKNGLWSACAESSKTLTEVSEDVLEFLNKLGPSKTTPLTGSTISFDRGFLKRHLPLVEQWFHYRNIDVSSFRLLAETYGKPIAPKGVELHRSLSDCVDSASALEYYVNLFKLREEIE